MKTIFLLALVSIISYPTFVRGIIVKSNKAHWLKTLQLNVPVLVVQVTYTHYQPFNSCTLY